MMDKDDIRNKILVGNAKNKLKDMPEDSIDMAMTSPPYWGLRDYGEEDQIGLESKPEMYVKHLMEVFTELKRVLKPRGTFYLNIGDTYSGSGRGAWDEGDKKAKKSYNFGSGEAPPRINDVPRKSLCMMPERVMMAMVNDGWILRNKIIWNKPNPMPESVKDRFSTGYEFVYMFSLNKQYYFDLDAVREPHKQNSIERNKRGVGDNKWTNGVPGSQEQGMMKPRDEKSDLHPKGKNPGDVWDITTKSFKDAHFAVYPPELCKKPIKASCPKKVCSECGSPYERDIEREYQGATESRHDDEKELKGKGQSGLKWDSPPESEFKGWKKTCNCDTEETKSGIVLDPFAGAGTTLLKAWELGRDYIGIELNEDYVRNIVEPRLSKTNSERLDQYITD